MLILIRIFMNIKNYFSLILIFKVLAVRGGSVSGEELKASEQCGNCRFDPERTCTKVYRFQSRFLQFLSFIGRKAAFGADCQGDRFVQVGRTGLISVWISDKSTGLACN